MRELTNKYKVADIYATYQGEQNVRGIGEPVIFLRLQGCHLRCYAKTLGVLCDTPEGLEREGGTEMDFSEILGKLNTIRFDQGIDFICLSGGDPLWRKKVDIQYLLDQLVYAGFSVSVETSGTISIQPYRGIPKVTWVLDYKLKSAGLTNKFCSEDLDHLRQQDIIKFVLYDEEDYNEFIKVYTEIRPLTNARMVVGPYWGGKLKSSDLLSNLLRDGMLGSVSINAQMHKLLTHADNSDVSKTEIPVSL